MTGEKIALLCVYWKVRKKFRAVGGRHGWTVWHAAGARPAGGFCHSSGVAVCYYYLFIKSSDVFLCIYVYTY